MSSVDRTSVHAILGRARKTVGRARRAADDIGDQGLADDLYELTVELDRLLDSTAIADLPRSAPPGRCA
jgi:hypothetical protein